jgi:hypothetical protein
VDLDPLSTITTGASWAWTAPATGYYEFSLENAYVFSQGDDWLAGESVEVDVFKAGVNVQGIVLDPSGILVTYANRHYTILHGVGTHQVNAGQVMTFKFSNDTSFDRDIDSLTRIAIKRVA